MSTAQLVNKSLGPPSVEKLRAELVGVSRRSLELRIGRYAIIVEKSKRGKRIYIGRLEESGGVTPLAEIAIRGNKGDIAASLKELGDEFLAANAEQFAIAITQYINAWKQLLIRKRMEEILKKRIVPPVGGGVKGAGDNALGTIPELNGAGGLGTNLPFEKVLEIAKDIYGAKPTELLEIVLSTSLTLKQVDRQRGIYRNRPNWLVIVSDPATYKSSTLSLLDYSRYIHKLQVFTPASLLPAKDGVYPLIDQIHNKVFIIPTLSEETADKDTARKVFAALESVYDGFYGKATGQMGTMARIVDTVIIAAVTPVVWEWLLPFILNIGSRWLVYRYTLSDEEALKIQRMLRRAEPKTEALTRIVSMYHDRLLDEVTVDDLNNVQITEERERDLEVLAMLTARLRAVWKREIYWETDDATGRRTAVEEVNVVQREAPGRAKQQLENFVRANVVLRRSSAEKIVGVAVVDEHAMRLAAKLALGSTSNNLANVVLYLAKHKDRTVSIREISRELGISKSQVARIMKVLCHPRVDLVDDYMRVKEPFVSVLEKYVLGGGDA